jgi:hypothetical protein
MTCDHTQLLFNQAGLADYDTAVILEMQAEGRCPACEIHDLNITREYHKRVEIASLNEDIAVEQAIDKMWRLAS